MIIVPFTPINDTMMTRATSSAGTASSVRAVSSAGSTTPLDRAMPTRWCVGKPYSADYYYDEDTTDDLPPEQVDLSDYWVGKVIKAGVGANERYEKWPAVFTKKHLKSTYVNKGAASKAYNLQTKKYHYEVIFGTYELHGAEGRIAKYARNLNQTQTSKNTIGVGRQCKKGSTMTGEKDPTFRGRPRQQNLNEDSAESAIKSEGSTTADKQTGPSENEETPTPANTDPENPTGGTDDNQSETSRVLFKSDTVGGQRAKSTEQQKSPIFGQSGFPTIGTKQHTGLLSGLGPLPGWKYPTMERSSAPAANARNTPKLASQLDTTTNPSIIKQPAYPNIATQDLSASDAGKINPAGGGQEQQGSSAKADITQSILPTKQQSNPSTGKSVGPVKRGHNEEAKVSAKRQKANTETFSVESISSSSEDEDKDEDEKADLRATIERLRGENQDLTSQNDRLRGENQDLTSQNDRLRRDWMHTHDELKSQFHMLADTTKEIHSTIQPLIARARNATSLLKKTIKSIPAEKSELKQTSKDFVDDNKTAIGQIVSVTNSKIKTMVEKHPKLSRLLYNHDEKTQEAYREWMAENETTSAGQQLPMGKQLSEGAEDDEEDHRDEKEVSDNRP